jgi:hypothetical protein
MFDFIRKPFLWKAWDEGLDKEIGSTGSFHLKSLQDLAVYSRLRGMTGKRIAEIGGGKSRVLETLAKRNTCFNIEKFEGADGGPAREVVIRGVKNVKAFLGEYTDEIEPSSLDVVFSVSVVEHVPNGRLTAFLDDGMRLLKAGGLWLHAIDIYLTDDPPDPYQKGRFEAYRSWFQDRRLVPLGAIFEGVPLFTCDIGTNPDNTMYQWGKIAPALIPLRQRAQSVSLLLGATKASN